MKYILLTLSFFISLSAFAQAKNDKQELPNHEIVLSAGTGLYSFNYEHRANSLLGTPAGISHYNERLTTLRLQYIEHVSNGAQVGLAIEYGIPSFMSTSFLTVSFNANKVLPLKGSSYLYTGASISYSLATVSGDKPVGAFSVGFQFGVCIGITRHIALGIEPGLRYMIGGVNGTAVPVCGGFRFRF